MEEHKDETIALKVAIKEQQQMTYIKKLIKSSYLMFTLFCPQFVCVCTEIDRWLTGFKRKSEADVKLNALHYCHHSHKSVRRKTAIIQKDSTHYC